MKRGKLKVASDESFIEFYCPGCKEMHGLSINGTNHPTWSFNGDYDKPTFSPSVLVRSGHYADGNMDCWCKWAKEHPDKEPHFKCGVCHSFVTDGKIQFLSDCTHELAGQTVDLPELND